MRMPGTRKRKTKGIVGSSPVPQQVARASTGPHGPQLCWAWKEAGLECSRPERWEGEWLLGGLRLEQEPLAARRAPPWNVLWQQAWAFCSEPAREQQGLRRTLY